MLHRIPFRLKLFGLAALALVALAGLLTAMQDRLVLRVLETQFEARAAAARPILEAALAAPMAERDYATIQAVIGESVAAGSFAHMVLVDAAGRPVAAAGWDVARVGVPPRQDAVFEMPDGESRRLYALPLALSGQRLGTLHFGMSREPIEAAHAALVSGGLIAAVLCLAMLVPAVELGSRWLFRPLARLEEAAEAVRAGDYDVVLEPHGSDEVARLTATFLDMLASMRQRLEALAASEAAQRALLEEARLREVMLRAAKEQAEVATRAKSEFLANISHEVRTPLNGILGMAQILAAAKLSPQDRESVEVILDSGRLLLGVINDLLDISRLESGRLAIEPAPVETTSMLAQPLVALGREANRKGLRWQVDLPADLPTRVLADRMRVAQVLVNLAGNAVKFTATGEVRVAVHWTGGSSAGRLRVEVHDTGIGIPRDAWPTLFDRFTQAESSTTRRYGGSGLGLAISRQLVTLMGGRIGFESEPGLGSLFWFELPLSVATVSAAGETSLHRVLVVEALASHRTAAVALLRQLGHAAQAVGDGAAALDLLRNAPFDLVLLDLDHASPGAFELARRIRALGPPLNRLPLLGSTAAPSPALVADCAAEGFGGVLVKPMRLRDLHPAIQAAVSAAAARPDAQRAAAP
jgi:signal transduction histidine kinase/AmiR/NasT family two-component response regulator